MLNPFKEGVVPAMSARNETPVRIDARKAQRIQNGAPAINDLLIWTVYARPADFPNSFICRPTSTLTRKVNAEWAPYVLPVYLEADSLDALRLMLPHGLICMARSADDEPQILESWI
jgi:hypothetical protein